MKSKNPFNSTYASAPKVRRPPGAPTKSQLRASAMAEAREYAARWKTLIPAACATWTKFNAVDLRRTEGNVHVLAGMVQMYYRVSRQDADGQVKAFFDKHPSEVAIAADADSVPRVLQA